jgi:outer membrane protein assembly factor BamB
MNRPHERLGRMILPALVLCAACEAQQQGTIERTSTGRESPPDAPLVGDPWPQFGGPGQNFTAEDHGLASSWPRGGPPRRWERKLGPGYSGIVVEDKGLYTMYRDDPDEVVVRLDARSGATVWEHRYRAPLAEGHDSDYGDGPNSTPLLYDGRLYTIGVAGLLRCLDAGTGDLLWSLDLWGGLGGTFLELGYSSSAIPYGETIIVLVGGTEQGAVALDRTDGHVVWKNLSFQNSYSTPSIMSLGGTDQLVAFMATEVVGADPNGGELRWSYSIRNEYPQNICRPLQLDAETLFVSTYGAGSRGLKVGGEDGSEVEELWSSRKLQCFYGSAVTLDGMIYGPSGYSASPLLVALEAATGELAWRKRGFALSNVTAVGRRLLILDDEGTLALATPGAQDLLVHAETRILREPALTPPTIVGTVVYARDQRSIVALDLQ